MRTKKHEILVAPGSYELRILYNKSHFCCSIEKEYTMIVLQATDVS
jgi:hypothetical protein